MHIDGYRAGAPVTPFGDSAVHRAVPRMAGLLLGQLAAALRAIGVEHLSAAGYAGCAVHGVDYAPECSITAGDLFRGTEVELYTMGTYSPDLAAMKAWLHAGIVSAGPANLGVGLSVCNGAFSAAQIDAYLTAISAAGARAIGGGRTRATTRARLRDRARWDGNVWREARAGDFKDDDDARLTDAMMRLTRVG